MVGLVVGLVHLENMKPLVDAPRQTNPIGQHVEQTDPTLAYRSRSLGHLVVDVAPPEHRVVLGLPIAIAKAVSDSAFSFLRAPLARAYFLCSLYAHAKCLLLVQASNLTIGRKGALRAF